MKKLILSLAVIAMLSMPSIGAKAVTPAPFVIAAGNVGAIAVGTTFLPLALFAMGAENVDWATPIFGKDHVFQEYPAGQNHVFVQAAQVNYVPMASKVDHTPYHMLSRFGTDSIRSD